MTTVIVTWGGALPKPSEKKDELVDALHARLAGAVGKYHALEEGVERHLELVKAELDRIMNRDRKED